MWFVQAAIGGEFKMRIVHKARGFMRQCGGWLDECWLIAWCLTLVIVNQQEARRAVGWFDVWMKSKISFGGLVVLGIDSWCKFQVETREVIDIVEECKCGTDCMWTRRNWIGWGGSSKWQYESCTSWFRGEDGRGSDCDTKHGNCSWCERWGLSKTVCDWICNRNIKYYFGYGGKCGGGVE